MIAPSSSDPSRSTTNPHTGTGGELLRADRFDAVVFDLDNSLALTGPIHAQAWKATFDDFLEHHANDTGFECAPFDYSVDYHWYVEGKLRPDGVRAFLQSRGIRLAEGHASDPPEADTVHGLGNRKNALFLQHLREEGVAVDEAALAFLAQARRAGWAAAVVSTSRSSPLVLEAAGLIGQFDLSLDGNDLLRLDIPPKPAPDLLLEAARRLGLAPARIVLAGGDPAGIDAALRAGYGAVIALTADTGSVPFPDAPALLAVQALTDVHIESNSRTP